MQIKTQYKPARLFAFLLLLVCSFALVIPARGQFRASIQGVVTDPSGAIVSGATVTLTDNATNHVSTTTTSSSGVDTFNALPPSQFTLTVDAPGF
jgi:plastocyanin